MSRTTRAALVLMFVVTATTAVRAEGTSSAVSITDPWLLENLGFAPDATNVYASPRVQAQLARAAMGVTEAHAVRASESATRAVSEPETASSFGTSLGHTGIDQAAFQPLRSTTVHEFDTAGGRLCIEGFPWFEGVFEGPPHGTRLTRFQFWSFDSSSDENILGFVKRTCNQDLGGPLFTILASYSSFGSGGFQSTIELVDDEDAGIDSRCTYSFSVRLDGQESAFCSGGDSLRIVGAEARWVRQVSPAPDTASFDDVPTTHLFFRHIEALVAAGVTAGCDEDSFCPDDALTRGQMAVFLAKALGL